MFTETRVEPCDPISAPEPKPTPKAKPLPKFSRMILKGCEDTLPGSHYVAYEYPDGPHTCVLGAALRALRSTPTKYMDYSFSEHHAIARLCGVPLAYVHLAEDLFEDDGIPREDVARYMATLGA